jgi:hypothetical protein
MRKLKTQVCPVCHEILHCPECKSDRLNKYGREQASLKIQYLCRSCGRRTVEPICKCPSHRWIDTRELSKSGTICFTCGSDIKFCPHCGGDSLTRVWTRIQSKDGWPIGKQETFRCPWCGKTTTRPTCNCDLPWMTPKAQERRQVRLELKPIIGREPPLLK